MPVVRGMGTTEQQQKITVLVLLHLRQPQIRLVHGDAVEALAGLGDGRGVLVEEGGAGRALGLGRVGVQGNVDHGRGVRVHRGLAVDKLVEALVDTCFCGVVGVNLSTSDGTAPRKAQIHYKIPVPRVFSRVSALPLQFWHHSVSPIKFLAISNCEPRPFM